MAEQEIKQEANLPQFSVVRRVETADEEDECEDAHEGRQPSAIEQI